MKHCKSLGGQVLIPQPALCQMLGVSRSKLYSLIATDPDFPVPIRSGESRQSRCYYVASEIDAWVSIWAGKRGAV